MSKIIFCSHICKTFLFFGVILFTFDFIQCRSKFPDYIKRCRKDDPHLDTCLAGLIESLRSRYDKGIPEFGIPPGDPLVLPELTLINAEKSGIKAKASSIVVTGLKDFQLKSLSTNMKTLEFNSSTYIPSIHFEGIYDVNAKFAGFKVKGTGPFKGNASDITTDVSIKGKLVPFEGKRYMELESAHIDVKFKKYHIRVDKLFKDKDMNEIFNQVINDPNAIPMEQVKALMNEFGSRMLVDVWNSMSKILSFDEFFL